jgi:trk system potassium uptake protein TrkA
VVVIDKDENQLEAAKNTLDVLTIAANGASPITMDDPDVRDADILIAVTASDEVNMVACVLAKKHGIKHTIARIRDMKFMSEAKDYLKKNFDIDVMLNPELITANEINRILMTPAALDVEDFAHGKIRLFETKIQRKSSLAGIPLKDIQLPKGVLAGMIFRDHRMIIPHGDDCFQPHDNAYFIGIPEEIEKFSQKFVQRDARKLHRVLIIGAGRAGRALAQQLDEQGVHVKVIDQDRERCQLMAGMLTNGIAICGDGTDIDLLVEEDVAHADARELDKIAVDETLPASADAHALDAVCDSGTDDGAHRRVHARRVAAAGQHADSFNLVHSIASSIDFVLLIYVLLTLHLMMLSYQLPPSPSSYFESLLRCADGVEYARLLW